MAPEWPRLAALNRASVLAVEALPRFCAKQKGATRFSASTFYSESTPSCEDKSRNRLTALRFIFFPSYFFAGAASASVYSPVQE